MTINGKDITLSEFEYLYHKNCAQQQQPQDINEYVDMFVNFKLKVAEAEAAGLDTTAAFRQEFEKFRAELSEPYMTDTATVNRFLEETYGRMHYDLDVSHIMLYEDIHAVDTDPAPRMLDSLRKEIFAGNLTFEKAAAEYSVDRPSAVKGGRMGLISGNRLPYRFEEAAYSTPIGGISPVISSGYGCHIIKVNSKHPARGEVSARHILKLAQRDNAKSDRLAKEKIDSLYSLLLAGADFADMAMHESEDPGSSVKGGNLGWFGAGMMVQPFDSIAFALKNGEMSAPFKSPFGYHIILKEAQRGVPPLDSLRDNILTAMKYDGRMDIARQAKIDGLFKKYGITPDQAKKAEQAAEVTERYRNELSSIYPEYRNLLNEYHDGILLFDISNEKVWERATKDTEGLEAFFQANREKYRWDKPRFKGTLIWATSDSMMQDIKAVLGNTDINIAPDSLAHMLRKQFGRNIKVERVMAAKGESPAVDYLAFSGKKPEQKSKWTAVTVFNGKLMEQPETAADIRGHVTTDYQNELERQWIASMRDRYKVKINKKLLKKVK